MDTDSDGLAVRSSWVKQSRRIFFRNPFIAVGTLIILFAFLVAAIGPLFCHYDPIKSNLRQRLQAPSAAHRFGTDAFGRDVLTRNVYAARISLKIALFIVVITTVLSSLVGVGVSWFRWPDNLVMRFMDVLMSVPSLILAIALMGFLGAKQVNLVIAIVVTQLPRMTRVVRSAAIAIRENEYIESCLDISSSMLCLPLWSR
jgi:peptide/nickel transport system permease protein